MGGTSTDVCRSEGAVNLEYESTKAGVKILTPTVPIETIAAGGGSVCWFDGVSLRVGPQSAGAAPGPACYGAGGPLTLTDVNLLLGKLPADQFPFPIDRQAAQRQIDTLLKQCKDTLGLADSHSLASGLRRIACEQMAEAVRTVSISQGQDPRQHTLVGFGGAAGCHVCEVAELLGIHQIIDHQDAGLLSALGMGMASRRTDFAIPVYSRLAQVDWSLARQNLLDLLSNSEAQRPTASAAQTRHLLELRYVGTDSSITIPCTELPLAKSFFSTRHTLSIPIPDMVMETENLFQTRHRSLFGYTQESPIELVSLRCEILEKAEFSLPKEVLCSEDSIKNQGQSFDRSVMQPGFAVDGPCVIRNEGSTLFVEDGWAATSYSEGTLVLEKTASQTTRTHILNDPISRDCFAQRLSAIAQQMGKVLSRTAISVNVKQRQDYSCAVFDEKGTLLANAAHVPVHLGAMGATVRSMRQQYPEMMPGDCFVTNDPFAGGSHLPT